MTKKTIRLTENALRSVIRESVNRILKEYANSGGEPVFISTQTIDAYQANEIAEQEGLESNEEAAAMWFKEVIESEGDFEEGSLPKYCDFKMHIDELDADLYYDWYAEYYFLVKEAMAHKMAYESKMRKSVNRMLKEASAHKVMIKEGIEEDRRKRDINIFANLITDLKPEQAKYIALELWWASANGDFDFPSFVETLYRHMEGDGYQREVDYDNETLGRFD